MQTAHSDASGADASGADAAAGGRRVDASMSLLVDLMSHTLDETYAQKAAVLAARRAGVAPTRSVPPPRRRRGAPGLVVLVVLGLGTGAAISQVRERQEAASGLRAELAAKVGQLTAASDALAARTDNLRAEVAAVRAAELSSDADGLALTDSLTALGLASGTIPVRGPGLVVTVQDAPPDVPGGAPEPDGTGRDGRIQDRDLQDVVNGLWAAGAEAVSVNDQRLTVLTAIRSAGEAILVDFRPLSPPYVVRAIGDPESLEVNFLEGPSGRRLQTFTSLYDTSFDVRRAESLSLAGAASPDLRAASPLPGGPS